jgi:hypothetical protein
MDNQLYTTCNIKKNDTVSPDNNVPHILRANVDKPMQSHPVNGGLYGGPQVNHAWMPQAVTPTETNLIMENLKSANPPPGALAHFVSTVRPGNNYTSMPNVYNFNQTDKQNCGPFVIHGTKPSC